MVIHVRWCRQPTRRCDTLGTRTGVVRLPRRRCDRAWLRHIRRVLDGGARTYVGVDGSSGMLAVARSRHVDERARFVEADLAAPLPFGSATFDRALVVLVLEHLSAIDGPLREIARVLRPTGHLRIVDIHPALLARGSSAHFKDQGKEVRFTGVSHSLSARARARATRRQPRRRAHPMHGQRETTPGDASCLERGFTALR